MEILYGLFDFLKHDASIYSLINLYTGRSMIEKWFTNAVRKVEFKLGQENFERAYDTANYGNFVKTPEFKFYNEAIKEMDEIDLSFDRVNQGSYSGLFMIFMISTITSILAFFLMMFVTRLFLLIVILVIITTALIVRLWKKVDIVHGEIIKYRNTLHTKLLNEKELFEKRQ